MRFRKYILPAVLLLLAYADSFGQKTLPGITIRKFNDRIIISWLNDYSEPISNLSIQRSYDSSRHFITIGSVLNPMNRENGFSDYQPPYDRMYYRVFISFEGGKYTYSESMRPEPDTQSTPPYALRYRWQHTPAPTSDLAANTDTAEVSNTNPSAKTITITTPPSRPPQPATPAIIPPVPAHIKEPVKESTYPSQRIYISKDNGIIINLPDAAIKKYAVKFYDEAGKEIISLGKIQEDYLILEKVNFIHSGWFSFELKEGVNVIEKNKIFIPKDIKPGENGRNGRN